MLILALAFNICSCQIEDPDTQLVIDQLLATQKEAISAPEIGVQLRIIAITQKEYINPEIIWQDETSLIIGAYDRRSRFVTEEIPTELIPIILKQMSLLEAP